MSAKARRLTNDPAKVNEISRFGEGRTLPFLQLGLIQVTMQELFILFRMVKKLHVNRASLSSCFALRISRRANL